MFQKDQVTSMNEKKKVKLTHVSILHYVRLVYRSVLLLWVLVMYILSRIRYQDNIVDILNRQPIIMIVVTVVFAVEMIFRFFPSRLESPGCQKQFARNYIKSGKTDIQIQENNATVLVAILWLMMNGIFGTLYMHGIFDDGIMILISCFYSVCDMICILFFCPFQTWLLKNKCCSTCRIYNWDYAMMFTPLFFVRNICATILVLMSFVILLRWEITFYLHPERFSEQTNDYLKCKNCTEKLCTHKKQLHTLWDRISAYYAERIKKLQ